MLTVVPNPRSQVGELTQTEAPKLLGTCNATLNYRKRKVVRQICGIQDCTADKYFVQLLKAEGHHQPLFRQQQTHLTSSIKRSHHHLLPNILTTLHHPNPQHSNLNSPPPPTHPKPSTTSKVQTTAGFPLLTTTASKLHLTPTPPPSFFSTPSLQQSIVPTTLTRPCLCFSSHLPI